jgi:hypothetical protein
MKKTITDSPAEMRVSIYTLRLHTLPQTALTLDWDDQCYLTSLTLPWNGDYRR